MDTKSKKWKVILSFVCFFLGVSLLLCAIGPAVQLARRGNEAWGVRDVFADDYQNTQAFRNQISNRLEQFLTMAAGGPVDGWYGWYDGYDGYDGVTISQGLGYGGEGWNWGSAAAEGTAEALSEEEKEEYAQARKEWAQRARELAVELANDKNLLYTVSRDGSVKYTNAEGLPLDGAAGKLPEGYNFLLYFDGEKVTVQKDGQTLDVYGDGYYDEEADWYLPGYKNFPAGSDAAKSRVTIACAANPMLYLAGNYGSSGGADGSNSFYWLEKNLRDARGEYLFGAAAVACGLALLIVGLAMRGSRRQAKAAIARVTGKLWFECKLLLTLLALAVPLSCIYLQNWDSGWWSEIAYAFSYGEVYGGLFTYGLWELFTSTGWLCGLFWIVWLWVNDLRHNPRAWRHSLLSTWGMKRPLQKRLVRRGWLMAAAAVALAVIAAQPIALLAAGGEEWALPFALVCGALSLLLALALVLFLRNERQLAQDMGSLVEQIASVRAGNLSLPLELPADADLAAAAKDLADIQQGMGTALEERIKSERMKVELVANVSHDNKTPLTSIIGYIELLKREEGLPPHVQDYVRILDQKSLRLKTMVQDVVEVSKAASGQLPVHPKPLDLGKLLRQTLADMAAQIDAAPVTVRAEIPEAPVAIRADGERLYRVFQNLIQNALQYSLAGSRVHVSLSVRDGVACASVKNTSATELPDGVDFTERFVRGDASRTDGGSGLGLSIARSFTEACGGRFAVGTDADLFIATVEFAAGVPLEEEPEAPAPEEKVPEK